MQKTLCELSSEELRDLFPIILKPYNTSYDSWYLEETQAIKNLLANEKIYRINHIGSTSVRDLISKPTVDILLEANKNADINSIKSILINSGWTCVAHSENPHLKISFCKGYTTNGFAEKVFHLHLKHSGDWDELYFKDYLKTHNDIAREYEQLNQGLKKNMNMIEMGILLLKLSSYKSIHNLQKMNLMGDIFHKN